MFSLILITIFCAVLVEISYFNIKIISEEEIIKFSKPKIKDKILLFLGFVFFSFSIFFKDHAGPINMFSLGMNILSVFSFSTLYALSYVDSKTMYIPSDLNLLALFLSFISFNIVDKALSSIIAVLFLFILTKTLSVILKKEVIGEGDFIVTATMASLLGIGPFFLSLVLAGLISSIYIYIMNKKTAPLVPFLTISTFICYIFDSEVAHFLHLIQSGGLI